MSQLKVVMLAQNFLPHLGGAERQIAALAPLMRDRGVDVTIVTRKCVGGNRADEIVNGIQVYRSPVPNSRALASVLFTVNALYRLWRIKPDVIQEHLVLSPTTAALAAKRLLKTPVIAKILRGGYLGDIYKVKRGKQGAKRMGYIADHLDRFLAISDEIVEEVRALGVPDQRIEPVPNGVDTERFKPAAVEDKSVLRAENQFPEGPVAIFAGRLSEEKNLHLLIEAWPQIRKHVPSANLIIIGSGEERERLQGLAGEGVEIRGVLDDLADCYRSADVFVLPSRTEGMSNSLLEAMATGLVCVVTRVGAAPELITTGTNGFLCEPDSLSSLTDAVVEAFTNPSACGARARNTVVQHYSLESVATRLVAVYKDLC